MDVLVVWRFSSGQVEALVFDSGASELVACSFGGRVPFCQCQSPRLPACRHLFAAVAAYGAEARAAEANQ